MFQYSFADIQSQLDTLSPVLRIWFIWLGLVVLLAPLLFIRHSQARIALLFSCVFLAVQLPFLHAFGITYFLSLPHLIVWIPLLLYLCREVAAQRITTRSPFGIWSLLAIGTLIITLVFDLRDFARWLAGERGIINLGPGISQPWFTVPVMIVAFASVWWYIFQRPKKKNP